MRQRIPQASKQQNQQSGGGGTSSAATPPRRSALHRSHSRASIDSLDVSSGGGSTSWEITTASDQDLNDCGGDASLVPNPVPMFHPLHYYRDSYNNNITKAASTEEGKHHIHSLGSRTAMIPASPGSMPLLWDHHRPPSAPPSLSGLRTSQLPSLAPGTFIPDSKYQAYMMGQPWNKNKSKPVITKICCAKFCIIFSWIAVMFLVFIGILLDVQPLYIPKVLPKHTQYEGRKSRNFYTVLLSERLIPASNAYKAAGCYFLTGFLSYAYLNKFWGYFDNRRRRQSMGYEDIPDADSTIPYGLDHPATGERQRPGRGGGPVLPTFITPGGPVMRAYQYNNRLSRRVWESLTQTMHRIGIYLATVWPRYQDSRRAARRRHKYTGAKDI